MITDIIDLLQKDNFYGAGENTEMEKGKYEIVNNFKGLKCKIKRLWLYRRK